MRSPFETDFRLTYHLDIRHQKELLELIQEEIDRQLEYKEKLTYLEVARSLNISRSIFAKTPYSDLFKEVNDLRVDYFSFTKLPEEERIPKQLKLIKEAIDRLKEKNEHITQSSVAREMGVTRNIFFNYQEFYDLVEEHRTGKGGFNIENLTKDVKAAIEALRADESSIGYKSVAKYLGLDIGTLSQKDEIREIIEANRIRRKSGIKIELDNVKSVIKELRDKGKSLSQTKIIKELRTSWGTLNRDEEIINYIRDEINKDEIMERKNFIARLNKVLINLSKDLKRISFRKVGREMGINAHKILNDNGFKDLVDKANERIERKKRILVIDAIKQLKEENQKITFMSIKRKSGLSRKYIESDQIRAIIEENK